VLVHLAAAICATACGPIMLTQILPVGPEADYSLKFSAHYSRLISLPFYAILLRALS
jgi:hypothetical protein